MNFRPSRGWLGAKGMAKKSRKRTSNKPQSLWWAVGVAVVLAAALIIAQNWWNERQFANSVREAAYYAQFPTEGNRIGPADAVVHVEEYFDFQCPHCQTASDLVVKRLIDEYVAEGNVAFTYRLFPIMGPESVLAAQAAFCAMEMDAFWPYQDVLFAKKGLGNRGTYSRNNLVTYARQIGLDGDAFAACLDGERSAQYVRQSYDHAIRLGLLGTPTFFVNGRQVNLTTWEDLFRVIDQELAAAGF